MVHGPWLHGTSYTCLEANIYNTYIYILYYILILYMQVYYSLYMKEKEMRSTNHMHMVARGTRAARRQ